MSELDHLYNSALFTREYFRQNVCRLCWSRNLGNDFNHKINNSLYAGIAVNDALIFQIQNCIGIDLTQDDSDYYPKKLCETCSHKIEQFNEFKVFCQNSNEKLNIILNRCDNGLPINVASSKEGVIKLGNEEKRCGSIDPVYDDLNSFAERSQHSESTLISINKTHKKNRKGTTKTKKEQHHTKSGLEFNKNSPGDSKKINVEFIKSNLDSTEDDQDLNTRKIKVDKKSGLRIVFKNGKLKKHSYLCMICSQDFKNEETLLSHKSEAHGIKTDGTYKCFGCDKIYRNRKSRLTHEVYCCKSLEDGYKCNICDRFLPKRTTYERHLRDHRLNKVIDVPTDTSGIFKCDKCNEQFTKRSLWKKHIIVHVPKKNYVCEMCGKVFTRLDYLNKHTSIHTGQRRYACPHCSYRSVQQQNIAIHIRKHTNERPFACDLCPQRCVSKSNLYAHRRRHLGLNSFQCSICNKKFGYKLSLKEHILYTHQKSQANNCSICGAVYARKSGLRRHMRSKHPAEISKTETTVDIDNANVILEGDQN